MGPAGIGDRDQHNRSISGGEELGRRHNDRQPLLLTGNGGHGGCLVDAHHRETELRQGASRKPGTAGDIKGQPV